MNAKIIAFPGQEKAVEEKVVEQQQTWQEWYEEHVVPFTDQVNALAPEQDQEDFWTDVVSLRDELNRWIGGG